MRISLLIGRTGEARLTRVKICVRPLSDMTRKQIKE
jgi:hypothetical protein